VITKSLRRLIPLVVLAVAFSCTGYEKLDLTDPLPVAALTPPPPGNPRGERVIVISIDGLRPDAITAARCPNLATLRARSAATMRASSVPT